MKKVICFFLGFLICVYCSACKSNNNGIASKKTDKIGSLAPKDETSTLLPVVESTLTPTAEPLISAPTESGFTTIPDTHKPNHPVSTPRPAREDRLNELVSESYKLLTETERSAFEKLHDTVHFRYFDDKDGYAARSATSYGVFSGISVWLLPDDTMDEYENTVCGHTFYYYTGCEIKAFKDGDECEINIAYSEGWLTEEDIAKLYEIHTLTLMVYRPSASEKEINRLNELVTESYKLLTEAERTAFEESHNISRERIRYFDGEDGYASENITSYGVFNGVSVWFVPSQMQAEYEMTICGHRFFHASECRFYVIKDGEECELHVAYDRGWLTEEDIALLHEIHTLVERVYYWTGSEK